MYKFKVPISDVSKEQQTEGFKTKIYQMIKDFVYKYHTHYYPHYQGEIDDLVCEYFLKFCAPKKHRNGEEFSELDRIEPTAVGGGQWTGTEDKAIATYVQRFVVGRLIDSERTDHQEKRVQENNDDDDSPKATLDRLANHESSDDEAVVAASSGSYTASGLGDIMSIMDNPEVVQDIRQKLAGDPSAVKNIERLLKHYKKVLQEKGDEIHPDVLNFIDQLLTNVASDKSAASSKSAAQEWRSTVESMLPSSFSSDFYEANGAINFSAWSDDESVTPKVVKSLAAAMNKALKGNGYVKADIDTASDNESEGTWVLEGSSRKTVSDSADFTPDALDEQIWALEDQIENAHTELQIFRDQTDDLVIEMEEAYANAPESEKDNISNTYGARLAEIHEQVNLKSQELKSLKAQLLELDPWYIMDCANASEGEKNPISDTCGDPLAEINDSIHAERFAAALKKYGNNPKGYISELSRCKGAKLEERVNHWINYALDKGLDNVANAIKEAFLDEKGNVKGYSSKSNEQPQGTADFTPVRGYMYASDKFFSDLTKLGFNVSRKRGKSSDYDTSLMSRNGNAWLLPYVYTLEKDGESHSYNVGNMTKESGGSYGWLSPGWSERVPWARMKSDLTLDISRDFNIEL